MGCSVDISAIAKLAIMGQTFSAWNSTTRKELTKATSKYIRCYNYQRVQREMAIMTPMEYHNAYCSLVV
ncbi:MAG: integrase core domain-containing protein [Chloroflexi bacterium]|nr:integrase core domain-containing protein [Chloroflexota bacterium]